RDDVPMVVVVRPRPAIITGTRVVQATDRVRRVTTSSRHRAAGDDYVLAAVPLKDPEGTEVAALREVHGDQDISGGLQSKKTARLVGARWLFIERNDLPVELNIDVTIAVGRKSFEAGVDDQVAVRVDGAEGVHVREVVLGGHALSTPIPIRRLLVVLCPARCEYGVVDRSCRRDVIHQEAGGEAVVEIRDVSI